MTRHQGNWHGKTLQFILNICIRQCLAAFKPIFESGGRANCNVIPYGFLANLCFAKLQLNQVAMRKGHEPFCLRPSRKFQFSAIELLSRNRARSLGYTFLALLERRSCFHAQLSFQFRTIADWLMMEIKIPTNQNPRHGREPCCQLLDTFSNNTNSFAF